MAYADLIFEVVFHGPVRVGRGRAAPGVDDTIDPDVIVPGSSLKGLMRAEADVLFPDAAIVDDVFGTAAHPSAWHWSDILATAGNPDDAVRSSSRIRIDSAAGTAVDGGLFAAQFRWPRSSRFQLRQFLALSESDLRRHEIVLWASALSIHSVGADRNRGFGWVDVARIGRSPDDAFIGQVAALAGMRA